ncbi:ABC-2 type transport system permease protein [Blastococcus aurantiacus]|uniref:ABC-2 type transport system permease protein n=1 Tax=Blastococcus aurantiacus TaxID=1550231 RepID=A0A1G7JU52_9ACTN|nr:ABC transporter permease [Blastococcus aurantiacus]SDF28395.1 ABC-2 type transport system permease protein [Blastococcus aurantiacus]
MTAPQDLSSSQLVRLVAGREVATRIRDKGFIISSVVILLVIVAAVVIQVVTGSGDEESRVGLVGGDASVVTALEAQGEALDVDVEVVELGDEAAARTAVDDEDVDGALLVGDDAELLVRESAGGTLEAIVQGAVGQLAITEQLTEAGISELDVPEVAVTALDADAAADGQRVAAAVFGVVILYSLLILFGQFIAQGVVEEKSSRVVELLLATMRPWQLLAGKILGLGLLALGQIVTIGVVAVVAALAFDIVEVPGDLISTVAIVIAWFVLGYAWYAAVFAVAASLVSRQEDLATVLMPTSMVLIVAFFIGIQAASDPGGLLARVTSYIPGLSPLVMPVRQAAGEVALWEIALAVVLMVLAIVLVVRLGGRIYSGALLRTGGKIKMREALAAERA